MNWWQALLIFGGLQQAAVHCQIEAEKKSKFQEARDYADSIGKPLLVIGGPYGFGRSWGPPGHGCGDVCLDINVEACRGCPNAVEGDIRDLSMFPDKTMGAAFASHVLEHLPTVADAEQALSELERVSEATFLVLPSKVSILAWLNPDHYLWVSENNGRIAFKQRGLYNES